jgi:replication factor C subunit 2/4
MPNLILTGPSGTGKTSSITCVARGLFGSHFCNAVLELNASDDRGVETVRIKIKIFAQRKTTLESRRNKIVILDEADAMTLGAQQALKRIMDLYGKSTSFVFSCNHLGKLIDAIQSRCAIIWYSRLSDKEVFDRMSFVCTAENVAFTDNGLKAIIYTSDGDMRKALNNLQATHFGFGLVNQENVLKICDHPHPLLLHSLFNTCKNADINLACKKMEKLCNLGFSPLDIIATFYKVVEKFEAIPELTKLEIMRLVGHAHMRIIDGVNTRTQLTGLLSKLCKLTVNEKNKENF